MSAILDAIDQELGEVVAKITPLQERRLKLEDLRAEAAELVGEGTQDAPAEPSSTDTEPEPAVPRRRRQAATPPPSDPPRSAGDNGSTATRDGRAAKSQARRAQILELVRMNPGMMQKDIAAKVGIDQAEVSRVLKNLVSHGGPLRAEKAGRAKRYFPREHEVAPADENGAKTETERKVLAAVQAAPVALTTGEVASNAKVNIVDAGRVLHGLRRRGLLRAIPTASETAPQRWELPRADLREAA